MNKKNYQKVRMIFMALTIVVSCIFTNMTTTVNAVGNTIAPQAGTKDNPTEIASLIYNLKTGDKLILGEGYYKTTGQAYIFEENITIQGAGADKTFIECHTVKDAWGITIAGPTVNHGGKSGSNAILKDFTIKQNGTDSGACIKSMGAHNLTIQNIKTDGGSYGIDLNPSMNSLIDNCEISSARYTGIGIGSANQTQSKVTIQNTKINTSGWCADVVLNDKDTYGNSQVIIKEGNQFKNGVIYTENFNKSDFIIDNKDFPKYRSVDQGTKRAYFEIPMILLSKEILSLEVGNDIQLTGKISAANPIQTIDWSSDNTSVATVDSHGKITAVSPGKVKITATAGQAIAKCEVTVYKTEVDIPTFDPTKPTDKVDVGISDKESKDTIEDTSHQIINDIISGNTVDSSIISNETLNKIKDAIDQNATITTKVESKVVLESDVKVDDIKQVSQSMESISKGNDSIVKVAQYLDIGVMLQAEKDGLSTDLGNIAQLDKKVTFVVAIPEALKAKDRKFYVVRVHEGVSEVLDTKTNADGTVSFGTDSFSTYALVYEDQKAIAEVPDTEKPDENMPNPVVPPKDEVTKPDKIVQTDDTSSVMPLLCMMGISLTVILKLQFTMKKKYRL
ncbi:MAG: Ig-like domain-containing protein [Coprobacillus sp.]